MALTPFLVFAGQAEDAIHLYLSVLAGSEVADLQHYGPDEPGPLGGVKSAVLKIADQPLRCMDSPIKHGFGFTPAVSFFYDCKDDHELDAIFASLAEDGSAHMPSAAYPFARRFTWVGDGYGVSWQLRVAPR
jgi:predicted 3-demethylubiquinone-9 3-methyltransferase (glyoxalase superfamily)